MKRTFLQLAKESGVQKRLGVGRFSSEEGLELALAWARGEIGTGQISRGVLGRNTSSANSLYYLAQAFRWGIQNGKLIEKGRAAGR